MATDAQTATGRSGAGEPTSTRRLGLSRRRGRAQGQTEEHYQPRNPQCTRITSHPAVNLGKKNLWPEKRQHQLRCRMARQLFKIKPISAEERAASGWVELGREGFIRFKPA